MAKGNPNIAKEGKKFQFSAENQPENRGRKGKSTTEYLKDIGNAREIKFSITITDESGKTKKKSGRVESESTINELLATLLVADAIKGNHKARKEILDRTEGKSRQTIDMNAKIKSVYDPEERQRKLQELTEKLKADK